MSFFSNLDLPLALQIYVVLLVCIWLGAVIYMLLQFRAAVAAIDAATKAVEKTGAASQTERRYGRDDRAVETLRLSTSRLPSHFTAWWRDVDDAIEKFRTSEDIEGSFLTRSVDELLPEHSLIDRYYNAGEFTAFPGILTSLGLLGTFIALFVGLSPLKKASDGTFEGLSELISGLSGKFLTSIVALGLSVLFLAIEMMVCQRGLRVAHGRLLMAISRVLPYLSPARLLLDIQRHAAKQSTALGHISTDFIEKIATAFRDDVASAFADGISRSMSTQLHAELGPTLNRVASTMEELATTVSRLESQKQDSVVGQLTNLTESLERSLKEALSQMGQQFRDALSGSASQEFEVLAGVVKSSAGMLGQMNEGFATMQSSLQQVVDEARSSTSGQMRAGMEQTERLNALVEGLMHRLNDSASENYEHVAKTLTSVVTQLSDRVTKLSEDLVERVGQVSERSQAVATETMKQAGNWSSQTAAQLSEILAAIQARSIEFERAGKLLVEAQGILGETLARSNDALTSMRSAAGEVKTYSASLAGLQQQLEEGQRGQNQVVAMTQQSIVRLSEAANRHDEFLNRYHDTLTEYRNTFAALDGQLASVLNVNLDHIQQYNRVVKENFESIVKSANEVMPRMAGVLKQGTDELREHIDELSDALVRGTERLIAKAP